MSTYIRIKLKNMAPMHVGKGKDYYDFSSHDLQSDTLSSALAAIRAETNKSEDLESFLQSFVVSSAFPYQDNHYFLPKMQGKLNISVKGQEEYTYAKRLKKIRYIEEEMWFLLASGKNIEIDDSQIQGKGIYLLNAPCEKFFLPIESQVMQRVTVPREEEESKSDPFFFEWNYFERNSGLYCLLKADSPEILQEVLSLFKTLGQTGIGSDRCVGGGSFEIESETIRYDDIPDANATVLLSLYIPTQEEAVRIPLQQSEYELVLRGGFMSGSTETAFRHLLKKSIYMFGTGSVFPMKENFKGKVVDLSPAWNDGTMHPVYRSGCPLCLFIKDKTHV